LQKSFESDVNTILELANEKQKLFERLENCTYGSIENGWEELFLSKIEYDDEDVVFFGHKLITEGRTRNVSSYVYTFEKGKAIILSLLTHLTIRFECDELMQECLKSLHPITLTSSTASLQLCHKFIVPDFDETLFITEYHQVSNLLQNHQFISPIDTLHTLYQLSPESFLILKTALARLAAAKPHSLLFLIF
jgi:hypothetical protein